MLVPLSSYSYCAIVKLAFSSGGPYYPDGKLWAIYMLMALLCVYMGRDYIMVVTPKL